MKDNYLKALEEELVKNNIKNKKDVLNKYSKRYDFGLEAGFTDLEIEEKLGSPDEVVKQYISSEDSNDKPIKVDLSEKYNVTIKTLADDIIIKQSKNDEIYYEIENVDENNYEISKGNNIIKIAYKKSKFFSLNRKESNKIVLFIPKKFKLGKVDLNCVSGDVILETLHADEIIINTVSGELHFDETNSNVFTYNSVSGYAEINKLKAQEAKIDIVSGKIDAKLVITNSIKINSVTGDVTIVDGNLGNVKSSTVSGVIKVNDQKVSNDIKDFVKGMFKK